MDAKTGKTAVPPQQSWNENYTENVGELPFCRQQAQENKTTQQQYRGVLFHIFQTKWLNSKQLMLEDIIYIFE